MADQILNDRVIIGARRSREGANDEAAKIVAPVVRVVQVIVGDAQLSGDSLYFVAAQDYACPCCGRVVSAFE